VIGKRVRFKEIYVSGLDSRLFGETGEIFAQMHQPNPDAWIVALDRPVEGFREGTAWGYESDFEIL
jgi:hypothetical protein